jgi:AcrR family transcriptional regulator
LQRGSIDGVSDLAQLVVTGSGVVPDAPDEAVVPFLEAACRAVEKFGWSRTTMRDIAREAGVERTTVYRHVGSMPDVYRLLLAHEMQKLMRAVPVWAPADADGPTVVVELVASAVEYCLAHPVLTKVISDEPELLSGLLTDAIPQVVARFREHLAPALAAAMQLGVLAERDPEVVTEWCVRIGLSLLVAPPPGDLRHFLDEVLRPVLEPPRSGPSSQGATA